jgi:hypothetical protein
MSTELSCIVSSRNINIEPLIKLLSKISDNIVILDTSDDDFVKNVQRLSKKYKNVKVVHTLGLGHPEPFIPYLTKKCKHDWIFRLDGDEMPNKNIIRDVNKILDNAKEEGIAAYNILRKNEFRDHNILYDRVIRLYNKKYGFYTGVLHETPIIKGSVKTLDDKYLIYHYPFKYSKGKGKRERNYAPLMFYEYRLNFNILIEEISRRIRSKYIIKAIDKLVRLYLAILGKSQNEEFSKLEYLIIFFFDTLRAGITNRSFFEFKMKLLGIKGLVDKLFAFLPEERREQMEISMKIRKYGGVTRFLGLDNEKVIKEINRKYKNKLEGAALLIELLKNKNKVTR